MKPRINVLFGFVLFLVIAPQAFSQAGSPQPCPDATAGTLGCELVAWSGLQAPVPLPEPESKPSTRADQRPGSQASQAPESEPPTSRQSITGIIVREGEKYILKARDNATYQLDDQERARQYQDKGVRVVGTVDSGSNTLHIESIDLVS